MLPKVVFGLVRLFSQIFQMSPKGPPFIFSYFSYFSFYICRHYATYRGPKKIKKISKKNHFFLFFLHVGFVEENTWHIEVLLLFLSLRYRADLGRSRLVFVL